MSEKSFHERVQEYNNGERETNPFEEVPQWKVIGFLGGLLLMLVLSWALILNNQPAAALIVIFGPLFAFLIFTESGQDFFSDILEEIERQQSSSSEDTRTNRICPECGWQNPQTNNYCHDCGIEFSSD